MCLILHINVCAQNVAREAILMTKSHIAHLLIKTFEIVWVKARLHYYSGREHVSYYLLLHPRYIRPHSLLLALPFGLNNSLKLLLLSCSMQMSNSRKSVTR